MMGCLQHIAAREVAAILGIHALRSKEKKHRHLKQSMIVQVRLKHLPARPAASGPTCTSWAREQAACKLPGSKVRMCVCMQAPEDNTDVVVAAKRVLKSSALESLGLQDKRDIAMLIAQSALQV